MPRCNGRLRQLRLDAGLSQNKMARLADLDRATISKAESGNEVSDVTVAKYARALSEQLDREVSSDDITE